MSLREPRHLAAIAVVASAVRVAGVLAPLPPAGLYEDALIARNLAGGHGFTQDIACGPTAVKAPLYPFLLVPAAWVAGDDSDLFLTLAGLVNALLGGVAAYLAGRLTRALIGPTVGLVAAAVVALHPPAVYLARVPESTNLSIALTAGAVGAILRARRDGRRRAWILAGAAGGLAALSNPVSVLALGATTVLVGGGRRRLLAGLGLVLTLAPWTARNTLVFGRPIAVKSPIWLDIYAGFLPDNLAGRVVLPAQLRARLDRRTRGLPELERERLYAAELGPWMRRNPGLVARLALWRVGQFWGLYGQRQRLLPELDIPLRLVPELALLAAAMAWPLAMGPRSRLAAAIAGSSLLAYTAVYSAIVAINVRYHLEALPFEALAAAPAIAWLVTRLVERTRTQTNDRM